MAIINTLKNRLKIMRTELIEKVKNILKGIDLDEVSDTNGWWETSSGAEFGAKKLNEVIKAIQALSEPKGVSAEEVLKNAVKKADDDEDITREYYREDVVIQAMHDYAGQSDAKEKAILFAKFITKYPDTDEAYEQLYQQFLYCNDCGWGYSYMFKIINREEK
jgi:hypothetical protein